MHLFEAKALREWPSEFPSIAKKKQQRINLRIVKEDKRKG